MSESKPHVRHIMSQAERVALSARQFRRLTCRGCQTTYTDRSYTQQCQDYHDAMRD